MQSTVIVKTYPAPPVDRRQALRYCGGGESAALTELLEACAAEAEDKLVYKVCFCEFELELSGDAADMTFAKADSRSLCKNLAGCRKIILFAATVGIGIDRLITKYSSISPSRALMLQALGAERIESLCDAFCKDISTEYADFTPRPRFSPGYGDLPLTLQKDIFAALDCPRKIGLSLNDSLLMSPSKSVTAIIGLAKR